MKKTILCIILLLFVSGGITAQETTQKIPANEKGYVKIGGEEWVAVSKDNKEITKDARVTINDIEGNKVIVTVIEEY